MTYRLVQKFVDSLGGHYTTTVTGPLSPLIIQVTWVKNLHLPIFLINKGRESLCVLDGYYHQLCAENKFREYFEEKLSKNQLVREYDDYASRTQLVYDEGTLIEFSKIDESALISFFKKVIATFELTASTIYIEEFTYDIATKVIGRENKATLDAIWEQATQPAFISFEGRRLAYLVKLIKECDDFSLVVPKVRYIYTDYYWTKSDSEIRSALDDIQAHLSEKERELEYIQQTTERQMSAHLEWEKSLTSEEKFLAEYIQMIMHLRDIRKDPIAQMQSLIILLAAELLKRAGIDASFGSAVNIFECVRGTAYLKSIKNDLIKRAGGNISLMSLDSTEIEVEICDYEKAVEQFYALTSNNTGVANTIKGQIASKGKVIGRVRIVLDPEAYEGFVDGDILVTSMTRPEFVPLMKRAGAVVTNEGGITCHAAIVSRELGIPCVIGTKNATRFLKDGDLVEVDAEKGVVRIIEGK